MLRINKQLPVWFRIIDADVIKCTLIGVENYMIDNGLMECKIETVQKIDGQWLTVASKWNNQTCYRGMY